MEYIVTLKYRLTDESIADEMVERLGEVGCTDCVVGLGIPARLALEFTRNASNARAAILSAIAEVKNAIPSACLIEESAVRCASSLVGAIQQGPE